MTSELQREYLQHRAAGLIHEQAVEAIALDTGATMAAVLEVLEHQDVLDKQDGVAPGNWKRPRHRRLAKLRSSDRGDQ